MKKDEYGGYSEKYGYHGPKPSLESPVSKSWLFEVVDSDSGDIDSSFTLVLPPTAISIKEPHRVSITKTFGNAFVDDYGPDNLQITLKGFSGTAHAFPTFTTSGKSPWGGSINYTSDDAANNATMDGYTGKDAFYTFRDTIIRYKDRENWDRKELRVYDFADEQAYKCILLDFTLDRQASQPLHRYPFTISLFVYQKLEKYTPKASPIDITVNPTTGMDKADSFLDKITDAYQDVLDVVNQVAIIKAKSLELRARVNQFLTQTTQILTSPLDLAKNLIEASFTAVGIAYDVYRAGKYTLERYMSVEEMINQTLTQALKLYGYQISQGWQASRSLVLEGRDSLDVSGDVVIPTSTDTTYNFSGLNIYTVKGDDTLQKISQTELGDESLWPFIASVNSGVSSNDDIETGDLLYIPVRIDVSEGATKEQYVFTEDIVRDPYGTDIKLSDDGGIMISENSDFVLVSGSDNVMQAIDLRMNTEAGSMIKQSAFGITVSAGMAGTTTALKYLRMATKATLVADARIESIDNMVMSIEADTIRMSMTINIVGSESSLPVTVVI